SVAQRLFFLPPVIIALATTPLWPAYSEALARGDRKWVRTIFMRSVVGSVLIAALGGAVLTLLRGPIFSIWVGPDLVPSLSFSLALAIWAVLYSWGAAVVVLLNADVVRDNYLGPDVKEAADRFRSSAEFGAVASLLGDLQGARVVDIGAGNGMASYAFARSGASAVYAVEPDDSPLVGRTAMRALLDGLPIHVIAATGEELPLRD